MAHQEANIIDKDGTLISVRAENLTDDDKSKKFFCKSCNCLVDLHICTHSKNYFASRRHSPICTVSQDHRAYVGDGTVVINLGAILNHRDKEQNKAKDGNSTASNPDTAGAVSNAPAAADAHMVARPKNITTVKALIEHLSTERDDYIVDEQTGLTKGELMGRAAEDAQQDGMVGVRLVEACRTPPRLRSELKLEGKYILLRAVNNPNVLLCLRTVNHYSYRQLFERIVGVQRPGEDFVLSGFNRFFVLGNWSKVENKAGYRLYEATVNTRSVYCTYVSP